MAMTPLQRRELVRILSSWFNLQFLAESTDLELVSHYRLLCAGEELPEGAKK